MYEKDTNSAGIDQMDFFWADQHGVVHIWHARNLFLSSSRQLKGSTCRRWFLKTSSSAVAECRLDNLMMVGSLSLYLDKDGTDSLTLLVVLGVAASGGLEVGQLLYFFLSSSSGRR
jgi:hypothetical protein